MVNPDHTKINYIPTDDSDNPVEQPQVAPVRPAAKSTKDFRRVLSRDGKEENEDGETSRISKRKSPVKLFSDTEGEGVAEIGTEKPSKDVEETASEAVSVSLFDLSKQGHGKEKIVDMPTAPVKETAPVESPSDLFKRMSSRSIPKTYPVEKESAAMEAPSEKPKTEHYTDKYIREQPDLSYVNPLAGVQPQLNIAPVESKPKIEPTKAIDPSLPLLIEQIVKHMYTVQTQGKTDTVMVLQYPPIFKDAQIVVSSYDTAKGQFNVSFENLTQAAQKLLDMEENRKSLLAALEQKGYHIQIVTTTTTIQTPMIAATETNPREGREEQRRQQGEQQQPRKQKG